MKNLVLVTLFVSALNFNVYASNPILEDLKNTQHNYLDYVVEKIRGSLDAWIRRYTYENSGEDYLGLRAFSSRDIRLAYDDENIVFYIDLHQAQVPDKKWHKKTELTVLPSALATEAQMIPLQLPLPLLPLPLQLLRHK